ncbi:hypothetical protein [Cellulosimicrobium sp. RS]|uniref:hypothetical protein n=1 Tax=Cellulosimicrobium sp. RS TaxID=3381347 RepID=UPI0038FD093A
MSDPTPAPEFADAQEARRTLVGLLRAHLDQDAAAFAALFPRTGEGAADLLMQALSLLLAGLAHVDDPRAELDRLTDAATGP